MSQKHYWQAKIWGLLHDPALKALYDGSGQAGEGVWPLLSVMQDWVFPKSNPSDYQVHIGDADVIASASDRSAIGNLPVAIDYQTIDRGQTPGTSLEITHLLSAEKISWKLQQNDHEALHIATNRAEHLRQKEKSVIPDWITQEKNDHQQVFWWFWRCFPKAICQKFNDDSLMLLPAETRLPDGSIWSHASITSALAGCLAGYSKPQKTRPYLTTFTFSPIQELIKASRKMRDFWAGSWVLHYLSAKICWKLAVNTGQTVCFIPACMPSH